MTNGLITTKNMVVFVECILGQIKNMTLCRQAMRNIEACDIEGNSHLTLIRSRLIPQGIRMEYT